MTTDIVPVEEFSAREQAALRAVGWAKLTPEERELANGICTRYGLDPLLKHLVIIDGGAYITRDGLLHVAWLSNDFDGIEVDDPVLDEVPAANGKRYWRTRARVYRHSITRPFSYPGRYPMDGKNSQYAEEMCIKVAEVMTLRRAFDVSMPTVEERWERDDDEPETPRTTTTLAGLVTERAASLPPDEPLATQPVADTDGASDTSEVEVGTASVLQGDDPVAEDAPFVAAIVASNLAEEPVSEPSETVGPESVSPLRALTVADQFRAWAQDRDRDLIRRRRRDMFPDESIELGDDELVALMESVEAIENDEAIAAARQDVIDRTTPTELAFEYCDAVSPLSGAKCTLVVGHAELFGKDRSTVHRAGLRESW